MKNLIIVGAGGFGREVLSYLSDIKDRQNTWMIKGFIDDNLNVLNNYNCEYEIINTIGKYIPEHNDIFVMAIGLPTESKLEIGNYLLEKGAKFVNIIHPTARVDKRASLGIGCVVAPFAGISCDVSIGKFVTINAYSSVGHDSIIGDGSTISSYASIAGNVKIGKGVSVGLHGCILPGCKVGDFAVIGAGSVVVKNVKPRSTIIGVPGKLLY